MALWILDALRRRVEPARHRGMQMSLSRERAPSQRHATTEPHHERRSGLTPSISIGYALRVRKYHHAVPPAMSARTIAFNSRRVVLDVSDADLSDLFERGNSVG